jgi:biotin operon repressor
MPSKKQSSKSNAASQSAKSEAGSPKGSPSQVRPATKKQQLIDLLSAANPVAVDSLGKTLGWQPHTVRAAITGLRKAGFDVENSKGSDGGGTCYRIVRRHQPTGKAA